MKNKNVVAATLAIMAMATFIAAFFMLAWLPVPEGNKPFLNQSLIALIGLVGTAFGFYLGSSYGSAQKNGLIEKVSSPPRIIDYGQPSALSSQPSAPSSEAGFIHLPLLLAAFSLLAFSLLIGCATTAKETPQSIATKSLLAMKEAIVTTATVGDRLCKAGRLTPETCQDLSSYYILAGPAYDLAADALSAAIRIDNAENWNKYNQATQELAILYLGITQLGTKTGLIKLAEGGAK